MDGLQQLVQVGRLVVDGHNYRHASRPPVTLGDRAATRRRLQGRYTRHTKTRHAESPLNCGLFLA